MKEKVTLLELVATKTIFAVLVAVYYWMCARRNWHEYYTNIQYAVSLFTMLFLLYQYSRIKKYHQEIVDEMAKQNLTRANAICLKIGMILVIIIAFLGALEILNHLMMGYLIVGMVVVLSIIRTIIFYVMDVKGI